MGQRRVSRPDSAGPRTLHGAIVVGELDLHGCHLEDAENRLERFLTTHQVRKPGGVVRIITGRGRGSGGAPVLQPAVREALEGWLRRYVSEWSVDVGGGGYLVRLRR